MTVAWAGICCSVPPCVAVSLREATYTYGNITHHQAFTVSIPAQKQLKQADYAGLHSGKEINKFQRAGLTPVSSTLVRAPYVEECPVVLECQVLQTVKIGLHTQFIGEIKDVKVDEAVFGDDGMPDILKIRPFMFAPGTRAYYATGEYLGPAFSVGRNL
jgi:flavin reductase (DIM6/NTAB) family NADH-FMN oxidoreductase RutF